MRGAVAGLVDVSASPAGTHLAVALSRAGRKLTMPTNEEQANSEQTNDGRGSSRSSQGFGAPEPPADLGESLQNKGRDALQGARAAAERGKDKLADEAQGVAQALHQASEGLRSDDHEELARYTQGVAERIEQLSGLLKGRDLASMAQEVARFAQRQPALVLGGAFTAGLIAGRFFKSADPRSRGQTGGE